VSEATPSRPGRNDRCPCGSGKKYKHCCLAKDAAADREARAAAAATAVAEEPANETGNRPDRSQAHGERRREVDQPWRRSQQQAPGAPNRSGPRKRGGGS